MHSQIKNKIELIIYLYKLLSNKTPVIDIVYRNPSNYKNDLLTNNNYFDLILFYAVKLFVNLITLCRNIDIKNRLILINYIYIYFKTNIINIIKFMELFAMYLVGKYYYKSGGIKYIMNSNLPLIKIFNFFRIFTRLKKIFFFYKQEISVVEYVYSTIMKITAWLAHHLTSFVVSYIDTHPEYLLYLPYEPYLFVLFNSILFIMKVVVQAIEGIYYIEFFEEEHESFCAF